MRRIGWVGVLVVPVMVSFAAACSKDSTPKTTLGPASSSVKSGSGTASAATTASAPPASTTATSGPAPCVAAGTPGTLRASQVAADVDGDATPDTVTVYATGTSDAPAPYAVRVDLGGGKGAIDAVIADTGNDANQVVKVLGTAEISASTGVPPDGSGAEIFVAVGSGAAAAVVAVYQVTGCNLVRLTGPTSPAPSSFTIGGTVTSLSGLRCDGAAGGQRLVVLTAESDDAVTYRTTEQRLRIDNGGFVPAEAPVTGTLDASDPALEPFSHLDCPGVESP